MVSLLKTMFLFTPSIIAVALKYYFKVDIDLDFFHNIQLIAFVLIVLNGVISLFKDMSESDDDAPDGEYEEDSPGLAEFDELRSEVGQLRQLIEHERDERIKSAVSSDPWGQS